jgi:hypothetical protein
MVRLLCIVQTFTVVKPITKNVHTRVGVGLYVCVVGAFDHSHLSGGAVCAGFAALAFCKYIRRHWTWKKNALSLVSPKSVSVQTTNRARQWPAHQSHTKKNHKLLLLLLLF